MNKANDYLGLVQGFHRYHYDTDLYVFLAEIIEKIRREGVHPEDCTHLLHRTFEAALRRHPEGKE